jgi:hypothetical protein
MTINVLRGRAARNAVPVDTLPIGDLDTNISNCPKCSRPLATGSRRCPGCGSRLLLNVQLARAAVFVLVGIAGGILTGVVIAAVTFSGQARPLPVPAAPAVPIASPVAVPAASTRPGTVPGAAIPIGALSALRQTAELNGRLMVGVAALEAVLAEESIDTVAARRTLRLLAADLAIGLDVAPRIDRWSQAGDLGARTRSLYLAASDAARQGLKASLSNQLAYTNAATEMVRLLGGLGPLDAESRELADVAGITLPAVVLPAD